MNSSTVVAPPGILGPQRRKRPARRLLTISLGVLLAGAVNHRGDHARGWES